MIRTVLTNGCEKWPLTTKNANLVVSIEGKILGPIKKWRDRMDHELYDLNNERKYIPI